MAQREEAVSGFDMNNEDVAFTFVNVFQVFQFNQEGFVLLQQGVYATVLLVLKLHL